MQQIYSNEQITHIRDQAMVYQCACPAHVCDVLDTLRGLYVNVSM